MAVTIDMQDDWKVWDNLERVTVESLRVSEFDDERGGLVRRYGPAQTWQVPHAKRRAISQREQAASGGAYTAQDVRWHIPAALLPQDFAFSPGDAVVDQEDRRWTILEVQENKWKQTWGLTCRDLVLVHGLRDKVNIERHEIVYDGSGVAIQRWPSSSDDGLKGGENLYEDLLCRVQETSGSIANERGIRGALRQYEVYVGQPLDITTDDRIFWQGRYLDITGWRQSELIDVLPVIEAQDRP